MNEFKINEFLSLKLENGEVNIYVKAELFDQCKYLMLDIPLDDTERLNEIDSIDEAADVLGWRNEGQEGVEYDIDPETAFWGHCSNLQAWNEHDYDTRLLHSNLSFPLLKRLTEVGDPLAKDVFKKEIAKRFESGYPSVVKFIYENNLLDYLGAQDLILLMEKNLSTTLKYLIQSNKFQKTLSKILEETEEIGWSEEHYLALLGVIDQLDENDKYNTFYAILEVMKKAGWIREHFPAILEIIDKSLYNDIYAFYKLWDLVKPKESEKQFSTFLDCISKLFHVDIKWQGFQMLLEVAEETGWIEKYFYSFLKAINKLNEESALYKLRKSIEYLSNEKLYSLLTDSNDNLKEQLLYHLKRNERGLEFLYNLLKNLEYKNLQIIFTDENNNLKSWVIDLLREGVALKFLFFFIRKIADSEYNGAYNALNQFKREILRNNPVRKLYLIMNGPEKPMILINHYKLYLKKNYAQNIIFILHEKCHKSLTIKVRNFDVIIFLYYPLDYLKYYLRSESEKFHGEVITPNIDDILLTRIPKYFQDKFCIEIKQSLENKIMLYTQEEKFLEDMGLCFKILFEIIKIETDELETIINKSDSIVIRFLINRLNSLNHSIKKVNRAATRFNIHSIYEEERKHIKEQSRVIQLLTAIFTRLDQNHYLRFRPQIFQYYSDHHFFFIDDEIIQEMKSNEIPKSNSTLIEKDGFQMPEEEYEVLQEIQTTLRNQFNPTQVHLIGRKVNEFTITLLGYHGIGLFYAVYRNRIFQVELSQLRDFGVKSVEIPKSITKLKALHILLMTSLKLESITEYIGELKSLRILKLSYNKLTQLPMSIENLIFLKILELNNNDLHHFPESLTKLPSLKLLNLSSNKIKEIPEIKHLKNLEVLNLASNQISKIPNSIGDLASLNTLILSGNNLCDLPEAIGKLRNLETLGLSSNNLISLPESIRHLSPLKYLWLRNNPLKSDKKFRALLVELVKNGVNVNL